VDVEAASERRLRELGLLIGPFAAGANDAITDVPGVSVGHVTVWRDEPEPPTGRGIARTGVTVVVPGPPQLLFGEPAPAGVAVLNGSGELTGFLQVSEWGQIETPVYLASTMAVGRVFDGAVAAAVSADPRVGVDDVVIPVVGECDDSELSDPRVVQVDADDAGRALASASSGPVAEGCVGAGTGMMSFDWKGGIGTASRLVPRVGATLGVLVLANYGSAPRLRIDGVPVGESVRPPEWEPRPSAGSCIGIVATDAPLRGDQLERIARRAGLGLARTGGTANHGSGEIFIAFSTVRRTRGTDTPREQIEVVPDTELDELFAATVDATEEAVANALWAAVDTTGRNGRVACAVPQPQVLALLQRHGRIPG
jgi:D-aminopeptidase